jgi:hypothetical protein
MFNITNIKSSVITSMGRTGLIIRKFSPEILTTVGILGMIGTTILASRATVKLGPIVEEIKDQKAEAKWTADELTTANGYYDKQAHTKAISKVYVRGGLDIAKLYGPSITIGLTSIGCIIAAHGIMQKRTVAIAAAYKALETTFSEYRKRVIAEVGEEKELDIRTNKKEIDVVSKDGKKSKAITADTNAISVYARFFDEHSQNWSKTSEYNLMFLKSQQNYANDLLHARGHVFLNDVYDMLDIPRSQAGQVVGWVISKDGDNFIDFGIYDHYNNNAHSFVNGIEHSILLDFNVDGVIYDLI